MVSSKATMRQLLIGLYIAMDEAYKKYPEDMYIEMMTFDLNPHVWANLYPADRAVLCDFKEAYEKRFGDAEETNISEAYCLVEVFLQMQKESYADDLDIPKVLEFIDLDRWETDCLDASVSFPDLK